MPLPGDEQQHVEHHAVEQEDDVGPQVPPAGQSDRVAHPRQADARRQTDGVLLRRPQRVLGHRLLHPEPLVSGRAVAGPVQAGVVGEDLQAGAHDEDHQEQVEEVLPAQPRREPGSCTCAPGRVRAGVALDEVGHGGHVAQALGGRDRDHQSDRGDGDQPQQVEPAGPADADPRCHPVHLGDRTRPRVGVDRVLAEGEL